MFPGMNKKQIEQAMKKMGIKQEEIDATEVIIKTVSGKDLIIKNPQVSKMNMMGQESLQVTGNIEEANSFSSEDIKTIMSQCNVSESEAESALKENDGDLAKTILALQGSD